MVNGAVPNFPFFSGSLEDRANQLQALSDAEFLAFKRAIKPTLSTRERLTLGTLRREGASGAKRLITAGLGAGINQILRGGPAPEEIKRKRTQEVLEAQPSLRDATPATIAQVIKTAGESFAAFTTKRAASQVTTDAPVENQVSATREIPLAVPLAVAAGGVLAAKALSTRPSLQQPMGVFGLAGTAARSFLGSSLGRNVLAGAGFAAAGAGVTALLTGRDRGGRRVTRGTNIITKRGMKQIRRIAKFKKQVGRAANALGFTLKRRGSRSMRFMGSRGVITEAEAAMALRR